MVQLNWSCVDNCPIGYVTTSANACVKFDPDAEKEDPDLLWLWILLGAVGCIVLVCVIAIIIAAMKKRKVDMLLGLNEEEVNLFEKEFSE